MQETTINWCSHTWGPFSGCEEISPECAECYAKEIAMQKAGTPAFPQGFAITPRPHKLREPAALLRRDGPQLIFCNSMSDPGLTGEGAVKHPKPGQLAEIPEDLLLGFWRTMAEVDEHRYQVLTKRPGAALTFLRKHNLRIPPSVWMGVTVGARESFSRIDRLREFRDLGARVLFLSIEPLLERLADIDLTGIDWVITGGCSGRSFARIERLRAEAMALPEKSHERRKLLGRADTIERRFLVRRRAGVVAPTEDAQAWVREIREKARAANCAFWHKQWGGTTPHMAGRLLDGQEWNGLPMHVAGAMPDGYVHKVGNQAVSAPRAAAPKPIASRGPDGQLHLRLEVA